MLFFWMFGSLWSNFLLLLTAQLTAWATQDWPIFIAKTTSIFSERSPPTILISKFACDNPRIMVITVLINVWILIVLGFSHQTDWTNLCHWTDCHRHHGHHCCCCSHNNNLFHVIQWGRSSLCPVNQVETAKNDFSSSYDDLPNCVGPWVLVKKNSNTKRGLSRDKVQMNLQVESLLGLSHLLPELEQTND